MANYRGATNVEFISHGAWNDPELVYDGKSFNYWDIEDALWSEFCEITKDETGLTIYQIESDMEKFEPMFDEYVQDNVVCYLEDVIFGGYFNN